MRSMRPGMDLIGQMQLGNNHCARAVSTDSSSGRDGSSGLIHATRLIHAILWRAYWEDPD
jgi:hypothetical protein